jgi:predicted aspartyl protease
LAYLIGLGHALPGAAADLLSTGIQQYKQGKYAEAIKSLGAFAGRDNTAATAYYYIACCLYKSGRIEDAKRYYESVARSYPGSQEAQMSQDMLSRLAAAKPAGDQPTSAGASGGTGVFPSGKTSAAASVAAGGGPFNSRVTPATGAQFAAKPAPPPADDDDGDEEHDARYEAEYAALPQATRIPFKRGDGGHMQVTVWLNNRPINCWFDTGAHAHFGLNHLQQVGISVPQNAQTSYASGWAGKKVPIWLMQADMKMGDMKRRVPISVEENMGLPPLVGQEFLRELRYEIDDKGGVMTLSKTRSSKKDNQFNSMYDVPCVQMRGDDIVPLEVEGKKTTAFIDTGAANTILHPSTLAQLKIEVPDDAPVVSMSGVGGSVRMWVMELDLAIGPIRRQNFRVLVGGAAGNAIGQDFMQGWRFTVDHQRHLLRFFH